MLIVNNRPCVELENFTKDEIACRCCGEIKLTNRHGVNIQAFSHFLSNKYKKRIRLFIVTKNSNAGSGYRCPSHNKKSGGVENSTHTKGEASDMWTTDISTPELFKSACEFGCFSTILAYFQNNFIHVDSRNRKNFEVAIVRKN